MAWKSEMMDRYWFWESSTFLFLIGDLVVFTGFVFICGQYEGLSNPYFREIFFPFNLHLFRNTDFYDNEGQEIGESWQTEEIKQFGFVSQNNFYAFIGCDYLL